MKLCCFVFFIVVLAPAYQKKTNDVTLNVHQRVNLLKHQIAQQIKEKQRTSDHISPISYDDDYTYVDVENKPITPIMDFDDRKKKDKFKLRQIIKRPEHSVERSATKKTRLRSRSKSRVVRPLDSFYRRLFTDVETPVQWIHCQDLITPFFSGFKRDITVTKRLTMHDHTVRRFIQLLNLNTTGHTKEEIYSILYQISNLQIRLFQWDVSALTYLMDTVIKNHRPHTFRNLIHGVRDMLGNWHLDIGNTTNLLKQARIFRPPCVKVSEYGGSTKTSKGVRYTKQTTPKSTCALPGATGCNDND